MAKKKTTPPAPPDLMKLGKRLKELRKEKGYTNHFDFAYDHGINPAQYGKYESGRGNITWLKLIELITALNVSVSDFFAGYDKEENSPKVNPRRSREAR